LLWGTIITHGSLARNGREKFSGAVGFFEFEVPPSMVTVCLVSGLEKVGKRAEPRRT